MQMNVQEFLQEAGITEAFYPGKRLVHSCKQTGQYKSHCVVFDWRDPAVVRIEVKAGLSGKSLEPKELKYYPISFQAPTYVDVEIINDNEDEGDEEQQSSGSGGGGGKKPAKKKSLSDMKSVAFAAFGEALDGKIPEMGHIIDMMVMGKQIAAEAYGQVMEALAQQIERARVCGTELMAKAGKFVTKYTPPSFMKAKGTEDATYKYDRDKNFDIGYQKPSPLRNSGPG